MLRTGPACVLGLWEIVTTALHKGGNLWVENMGRGWVRGVHQFPPPKLFTLLPSYEHKIQSV